MDKSGPRAIYSVPGEVIQVEYEVKKSRFIARAARAENRQQAMAILEQAKVNYADARHHCWAYVIGNPLSPLTVAFSDDGEPTGTAGKPILNVLQHKHIGDIMLVVSRYFGGIKLGAGGLVRAYSQAAQQVISELSLTEKIPLSECSLRGGYEFEQPLRYWLAQHNGQLIGLDYIVDSADSGSDGHHPSQGISCRIAIADHFIADLRLFIAQWEAEIQAETLEANK